MKKTYVAPKIELLSKVSDLSSDHYVAYGKSI